VPVIADGRARGAVRVTQGVASVNRAVRRSWLGLGAIGALVLALGLVAGALIARRIAQPIVRLDEAAGRVAAGDLTARARVEGSTEQRALARTFNAMTERLATLLATQRDFVADASHQLRTPLTGLRLRLEGARADAADASQQADLGAALDEVDRLSAIVDNLLELSRAGESTQPAATTDPDAAVRRAAARFAGPARSAGCELRVIAPSTPPVPVVAHEADLDRILDVLLENALAYGPGRPVELQALGSEIRVRDHGAGIAADEVEAVFERFHRGEAGRSGPQGTGLGLAIARDLARRWGGDVRLQPAAGGGACAVVSLVALEG
jgi:signal transduction histidine kinase